ncbi:MAG: T9SS type A sorting domain-containing protein [Bacteroidota bacterium]|nr:T9SS type A sorting domain-containing protein [Bacteroidota bacterium]
MAVYNNELYIGGYFDRVNGDTIYNIAKFDGTSWSDVGGGLNSVVFALLVDSANNRLYASGNFNYASGGNVYCPSNVAYWDGGNWIAVGSNSSTNLYPRELAICNGTLYAGFTHYVMNQFGDTLNAVAKWDGTDWQPLGKGLYNDSLVGSTQSLLAHNNELIVGGNYTSAGNIIANRIAIWNDTLSGLNYPSEKENIQIFPNPTTNTIIIDLEKHYEKELPLTLVILNVQGIIIKKYIINSLQTTIENNGIKSGIYF